jgi:hypothetical protein
MIGTLRRVMTLEYPLVSKNVRYLRKADMG